MEQLDSDLLAAEDEVRNTQVEYRLARAYRELESRRQREVEIAADALQSVQKSHRRDLKALQAGDDTNGETVNIPLTFAEVDLLQQALQFTRGSKQGSHDEDPQRVAQLNALFARLHAMRPLFQSQEAS